jgi:alpha-1,4-digalacturonate transport system substrate-binding protein
MCYQDGNECDVTADLIKRYEAQHAGAKVILDVVPYKTVVEQLPMQLAAGQGPTSRVSPRSAACRRTTSTSAPYVKDRKYWEDNFGSTLPWMRNKAGDKGIYGFLSQLTMTGPFVNKTLVRAGQDPHARPQGDVGRVGRCGAQGGQGHADPGRHGLGPLGPPLRRPGRELWRQDLRRQGQPRTVDDGYKTAVGKFVAWHKDGTMLKDVWGGSGGSSYADTVGEFKNGRLVMVLSGSWQINRMQKEIGNSFDWVAVPNPCGPAACSGMPGGAAWVALKTTKSPKEVGQFLDFMAQEANVAEFASRTNNIPAHAGVAKKGVAYPTAGPAAQAALGVFTSGTSTLAPAAYALQGYKYNRALMLPTVTRVTQAIVGEISVDEAVNKIGTDMAEAVKQAEK